MFLLLYGKFLIPELVDEDEVLYLGNNTIIDQNLDDLFAIDVEDKPLYCLLYTSPSPRD